MIGRRCVRASKTDGPRCGFYIHTAGNIDTSDVFIEKMRTGQLVYKRIENKTDLVMSACSMRYARHGRCQISDICVHLHPDSSRASNNFLAIDAANAYRMMLRVPLRSSRRSRRKQILPPDRRLLVVHDICRLPRTQRP